MTADLLALLTPEEQRLFELSRNHLNMPSNHVFEILLRLARERKAVQDRWIPVSERLPEKDVKVLWHRDREREPYIDCITDDEHPEDYYTRWQPLPALPQPPSRKEP